MSQRSQNLCHRFEQRLCEIIKPLVEPIAKRVLIEHIGIMVGSQRKLSIMLNPKQYKILGILAPFMCPFKIQYHKRIPHISYRMNGTDAVLEIVTCATVWNILVDNPYHMVHHLAQRLHIICAQWTLEQWTEALTLIDSVLKQLPQPHLIRSEFKRMCETQSSHYPWWIYDEHIVPLHIMLNEKLNGPFYNTTSDNFENPPQQFIPLAIPVAPSSPTTRPQQSEMLAAFLIDEEDSLTFTQKTALVIESNSFYDFFKGKISMAEIQYFLCTCCDLGCVKKQLEIVLQEHISRCESFPNNFEMLKSYFSNRIPKPSNDVLFKIWHQTKGDWNLIKLI